MKLLPVALKLDHEVAKLCEAEARTAVCALGQRAWSWSARDAGYPVDLSAEELAAIARYRATYHALTEAWRRITDYYDSRSGF